MRDGPDDGKTDEGMTYVDRMSCVVCHVSYVPFSGS